MSTVPEPIEGSLSPELIMTAYRIESYRRPAPDWTSALFDISAKLPEGAPDNHIGADTLKDRAVLLRTETPEDDGVRMVFIAPSDTERGNGTSMRRGSPWRNFAGTLTPYVEHPVIDMTAPRANTT